MAKNSDQNAETVRYDVEALHQKAVSALNSGDLESLMSVYAEEVIMMPKLKIP